LIFVTVSRSCSWFACSPAFAAVLTVTFRSGYFFSSSFFASLAHQTMPAVKLCVAAGIATPRLTLYGSAGDEFHELMSPSVKCSVGCGCESVSGFISAASA
jgi:hypothetical protein